MKNPRTGSERSVRILTLAFVFFVSGLVFFFFRMTAPTEVPAETPIVVETKEEELVPSLAHLPRPETYEHFTYGGEVERTVTGTCTDTYYVLMLFAATTDYRVSPLDARYNSATRCSGTTFSATIPLSTLSLETGKRYYVVKAHQGDRGGWHDPY